MAKARRSDRNAGRIEVKLTPAGQAAKRLLLAQVAAVKASRVLARSLRELQGALRELKAAGDVGSLTFDEETALPDEYDLPKLRRSLGGLTWQATHTAEVLLGVCPTDAARALLSGDGSRPFARLGLRALGLLRTGNGENLSGRLA